MKSLKEFLSRKSSYRFESLGSRIILYCNESKWVRIIDLSMLLGSEKANEIYALEQKIPGKGYDYYKSLEKQIFKPKPYDWGKCITDFGMEPYMDPIDQNK